MGSVLACCINCFASVCDLDSIFSYSTVKIVHIRDFRLGLIHRTIQIVILLYFLIYVVILQRQYSATEASFGDSLTKMHGMTRKKVTKGDSVTWTMDDAESVVYPATENNALFLATQVWSSPGQAVGKCDYPDTECDTDSDCDGFDEDKQVSLDRGTCNTTTKHCEYEMWCPAEDPFDKTGNDNTERWDYEIEDFTIWVKSSIMFPTLDPKNVYSTIRKSKPVTKEQDPKFYNLFPVSDLLDKVNVAYADIQQRGCILELTTNWDCDLNTWYHNPVEGRCKCEYSVRRLDDPEAGSGFNFRRTLEYKDDKGVLRRDLFKYMGMRIVLVSKGIGYQLSVMQCILQCSSLFALLVVSTTVCDFVINYVLRRYRAAKVKETKSFLAQQKHLREEAIKKEKVTDIMEDLGMMAQFANLADSDDEEEEEKEDGEDKDGEKKQLGVDEKSSLLVVNGSNTTTVVQQQEVNIEHLTDEQSSEDSSLYQSLDD